MESNAENAHFQPSTWGFLAKKHLPRFGNHGALTVDFRDRRKPPVSRLRSKSKCTVLTPSYEGNNNGFKECLKW